MLFEKIVNYQTLNRQGRRVSCTLGAGVTLHIGAGLAMTLHGCAKNNLIHLNARSTRSLQDVKLLMISQGKQKKRFS